MEKMPTKPLCNPLTAIWNYCLHQLVQKWCKFLHKLHQKWESGVHQYLMQEISFFNDSFCILLPMREFRLFQKTPSNLLGNINSPSWCKAVHHTFLQYTTLHWLGLLVFQAFSHREKCLIAWRTLSSSLDANFFLFSPYIH